MLPQSQRRSTAMLFSLVVVYALAILTGAFHPTLVFAQDTSAQKGAMPNTVIKMLRYADAGELIPVIEMLEVQVALQEDHNALVLRAPGHLLDVALKVLEAVDQPPGPSPMLEVRGYIVAAGEQGGALPEEVRVATERLGEIFGYRAFRLLDTLYLSVREGSGGEAEGVITSSDGKQVPYRFGFNQGKLLPGESPAEHRVRLDGLVFRQGGHTQLSTDIETRVGQTAVVGKAQIVGLDEALILVIKVEIEE